MTKTYNCEGSGIVQMDVLLAICGNDLRSMVDICSGECPNTRRLPIPQKTYIDVVYRNIGNEQGKLIVGNVLTIDDVGYFDVSIALDCLEHFRKQDAYSLIKRMQLHSKSQIIFTPLGDYLIEKTPTDDPDSHKSGWEPKEFEDMGWHTIVFPNFHPTLGIGAFFAINNFQFEPIINQLNQKEWSQ